MKAKAGGEDLSQAALKRKDGWGMVKIMAGENRKLRQCIPECPIISAEQERAHLLRMVRTAVRSGMAFSEKGEGKVEHK